MDPGGADRRPRPDSDDPQGGFAGPVHRPPVEPLCQRAPSLARSPPWAVSTQGVAIGQSIRRSSSFGAWTDVPAYADTYPDVRGHGSRATHRVVQERPESGRANPPRVRASRGGPTPILHDSGDDGVVVRRRMVERTRRRCVDRRVAPRRRSDSGFMRRVCAGLDQPYSSRDAESSMGTPSSAKTIRWRPWNSFSGKTPPVSSSTMIEPSGVTA